MEFADVQCFSDTFNPNTSSYKPGEVFLYLDLSNHDHPALKEILENDNTNVHVEFPYEYSNGIIVRGDVNMVIQMKSRLRKWTPLVAFIDLPDNFPEERVKVICNLIQDRTSITVSPFWCGIAYSVYLSARSDQTSTFNLVFDQVLRLLKSYGVRNPLCYSPIEIDPEYHSNIYNELQEHSKTCISPQDVMVKFPQNLQDTMMESILCLHGNMENIPKMKMKLYQLLPVNLSFNFNVASIDELDVRCIEEERNVKIEFTSDTAEISTTGKYFKDLFEARQSMYNLSTQ